MTTTSTITVSSNTFPYVIPPGGTFFIPVLYGDLLLCVGEPFLPKREEEETFSSSNNYFNTATSSITLRTNGYFATRPPRPPEGVGPIMFQRFWNLKTNQMEELYLGGYTEGLLENFDPEGAHAGWQRPGTEQQGTP